LIKPERNMFKKILVLCFSGNMGGMELDALRMSRRVSNDAQVTLLGLSGSPLEAAALEDGRNGCRYGFVGCELNRFFARALVDPRIVMTVRKAVVDNDPDMLIFFGTSEVKSIGIALVGLSAKLVLRIGTTINRPKSGLFQRLAYNRVNGFLAISEHIRRNVLEAFPVASKRPVQVCYPVVELACAASSMHGATSPINILYHSRFVRGKGQLDALIAFERVSKEHKDLTMTLVGIHQDESYVQEIKQFVQSKSLTARVQLLESTTDIESHLRRAAIFLGPSYGEGFSNSFAEALAGGLVCVTYDNTAFPFFKALGFEFFMAPTGDSEALTDRLVLALKAVADGSINTAQNAELASKLFSTEAERSALDDLYRQLT